MVLCYWAGEEWAGHRECLWCYVTGLVRSGLDTGNE